MTAPVATSTTGSSKPSQSKRRVSKSFLVITNLDLDPKANFGLKHSQIGQLRMFTDERQVTLHQKRYDKHYFVAVSRADSTLERPGVE
jgi:hypothetical protein